MTGRGPLARLHQHRLTPVAFAVVAVACAPDASPLIVGDRPHDPADTAESASPVEAADPWVGPIDFEA
ncbi:MAG: hypothetical protein P3B98_11775, partial [Gemmatimonadota bacterium]|nr:hypothetical protein [Gemmatimonadota bacterium]